MVEAGLIASRWLHYAAVTGLFGLVLFPLYAPRTALSDARGSRFAAVVLAAVAAGSALAWFVFAVAVMAGDMAQALATIPMVLTGSDFGPTWAVRVAMALALCLPAVARAKGINTVLAGLLLASLALTGHARVHDGLVGWLHVSADALHLLAAGAWLGALAAFLWLLRSAPEDPATARAMSDFARIGSLAVAVLVASGAANAWLVLGAVQPLFTTLYGRLLLLKLALFAGMLALAGLNRFRLAPALAKAPTPSVLRGLRRHVLGEQGLGLAVLLVVSVIGTLDPTA